MRRTVKAAAIFLCITAVIAMASPYVYAEDSVSAEIPEDFSDLLASVPDEISDLLPSRLFDSDAVIASEGLSDLLNPKNLFPIIAELIGVRLQEGKTVFLLSLGLIAVSAVISKFSRLSKSESGAETAVKLCIFGSILGFGYPIVTEVKTFFGDLTSFISASVPLIGTAYALGGSTGAAASGSAGLTVALSVCGEIFGKGVIPIFYICLALSATSVFGSGIDLSPISDSVKKLWINVMGVVSAVLSASLGLQTVIAARTDTLAMKSAKYAAGALIPAVGGTVAGALGTLGSSVALIRSTVGFSAVAIIALMLIPSFLTVMIYRLVFSTVGSVAGSLGCGGDQKIFSRISELFGFLAAAECICSICFAVNFAVLAGCAAAV